MQQVVKIKETKIRIFNYFIFTTKSLRSRIGFALPADLGLAVPLQVARSHHWLAVAGADSAALGTHYLQSKKHVDVEG